MDVKRGSEVSIKLKAFRNCEKGALYMLLTWTNEACTDILNEFWKNQNERVAEDKKGFLNKRGR